MLKGYEDQGYGMQTACISLTRETAATVFEQAGVPEGVTADIVGHEKQRVTYGLYSDGTSVTQRQEAMVTFETLMRKEKLRNVIFEGDKKDEKLERFGAGVGVFGCNDFSCGCASSSSVTLQSDDNIRLSQQAGHRIRA